MTEDEARAVLGVPPGATQTQIRAAYLAQVKLMHPDRLQQLPEEQRKTAEANLVRINEAWGALRSSGSTRSEGAERGPASAHLSTYRITPRFPGPDECEICGSWPAIPVSIKQVSSFLIWVSIGRVGSRFCRACGLSWYSVAQSGTLTRGWWGIGLVPAIPALFTNAAAARKLRRSRPPVLRDPAVRTPASDPMPPAVIPSRRPSSWIVPALAAVVIGVLAVVGINAVIRTPSTPVDPQRPATAEGSCWTAPDSNQRIQQVSCGSSDAVYRVTTTVSNPDQCQTDSYVEISSRLFGCLVRR